MAPVLYAIWPLCVQTQWILWFAVELLQNEVTEKLPSEAENLQTAIGRLQSALNKASQYVDDVVVSCVMLTFVPIFYICLLSDVH